MTIHNPYSVHSRKPLTDKQRLQLFIDEGGICCICGAKIDGVKSAWDEHIDPLWLSGTNARENRGVAHAKCARVKSAGESKDRAKVRSTSEKHFGAHRSSRPMPGSRRSRFKKRMDGTVVER